ncbi:MAG: Rrf2 family transcriptional regulator [Cytophagales bacterium]|nr:Rrf2 family transcriptional regulator [Cytophagales bacterium]
MFSKSCQYALQAILYIALHSKNGKPVGLRDIAERQQIPLHFLSKILQTLVKHKILVSSKGPNGGFSLEKSPGRLKLVEIVRVIDGLDIFDQCGIGLKKCSDKKPCPVHFEYKVVKDKTRELLNTKTLKELCQDIEQGRSFVSYV